MPPSGQRVVRVRAPGRVNLIGEHTDYSHLPVLPFAIDRSLLVTVTALDTPELRARSASFAGDVTVSRVDCRLRGPSWGRYLGGVAAEMQEAAPGRGACIEAGGDLPSEGGLASSSAFTAGVTAALAALWDAGLSREEVAARAARAERRTGVETGGMDQAVIAFAEAGAALRIDFEPAGRRSVPLPAGLAFVVASSGEPAAKGGAAKAAYNERVIGARLAAALLCDMVGVEPGAPPRLADVAGLPEAELLVEELPERAAPAAVARSTGLLAGSLAALTAGRVNPREQVPVRRYARHILSEARRVDEAEAALRAGNREHLGVLLDASHESLRTDFACSTPALDTLCKAMRKAGAFGARLTGAGFGGFVLAACDPATVQPVIAAALACAPGPAFEVRACVGYTFV